MWKVIIWTTFLGEYHREDGPAVEYDDGRKQWWVHDMLHRLDGPAVIDNAGYGYWYVNNYHISNQISAWAEELGINLKNLTDDDKTIIAMVWSNFKE